MCVCVCVCVCGCVCARVCSSTLVVGLLVSLTKCVCPYWQGWYLTALCQFRDDIIVATDAPPQARAAHINHVRTTGGGGGEGILYRVFSAGENSARGMFRTCPKKSRGKFCTSQILSALQAKGNLRLRNFGRQQEAVNIAFQCQRICSIPTSLHLAADETLAHIRPLI